MLRMQLPGLKTYSTGLCEETRCSSTTFSLCTPQPLGTGASLRNFTVLAERCKFSHSWVRVVSSKCCCDSRCEILFPLYSVLKDASLKLKSMNMILLHLRRKHLMEWVRNVIATTLQVRPGGSLPSIWLQVDADDSYAQLVAPLQGVPANTWVGPHDTSALYCCLETAGVIFVDSVEHRRSHASDKFGNLGGQVQL